MTDELRESFRLLELGPQATVDDARRSHRELVKVWHPDRFAHDTRLQQKAQEKLKAINLAYKRVVDYLNSPSAQRDSTSAPKGSQEYQQTPKKEENRASRGDPRENAPNPSPSATPSRPEVARAWPSWATGVVQIVVIAGLFFIGKELLKSRPESVSPTRSRSAREATSIEKSTRSVQATKPVAARNSPEVTSSKGHPGAATFTLGSHKDDVARLQGTPDRISRYDASGYEIWSYGLATVEISTRDNRVREWSNAGRTLRVSMVPGPNVTNAAYFTLGSHRDDVIRLQGAPNRISRYDASGYEIWSYGLATVEISTRDNRVREWSDAGNTLKVSMAPGRNVTNASYFTLGSHRDDVIRLQGTPNRISRYDASGYEIWSYGLATVEISTRDNRVREWSNAGNTLKVSMPVR